MAYNRLMALRCNVCIGKCFGLGINVSPFLRTLFCVSVTFANMTKASSWLSVRCIYVCLFCFFSFVSVVGILILLLTL